jgi:galactokinase
MDYSDKPFDTTPMLTSFSSQFGGEPLLVRSPGRVNIIGEHTDYNEGFVLPAAIDKAAYVAVSRRQDNEIHLYAQEFNQPMHYNLSSVKPVKEGWPNYILGVVAGLQKRSNNIGGFNLVLDGNVPIGAGLSSSAAVECATAFALDALFGMNIPRKDLAFIAQKAEHEFAGVKCGIMDQFASMFGKKDHVIRLDCRSIEYDYVPLKMEGIKVLLLNTNVKHKLSDTEYNTRRQQCEQGVAWVREKHPGVKSLRDVTLPMLDELVKSRDNLIYRRCRYVVEENQRLLEGCEDLKRGDIQALGQKMYRTHTGLSREYEVSCPELDFLVEAVRTEPAVLGARMMGGGFGGCTINLVREEALKDLVPKIAQLYKEKMGLELTPYIARIEDGTSLFASKVTAAAK